jgi:hypothetical protein
MLLSDVEKLRSPIEQRSETSARHRRIKKVGREGDVKVFYQDISTSPVTYWVGGDRREPTQIPWTLPAGETFRSSPNFWVFGSGLDDWGFTIKTRVGANNTVGTVFRIYTIYGDGRIFTASNPKLWTVTHFGAGVWLDNDVSSIPTHSINQGTPSSNSVGSAPGEWNIGGNSSVSVCVSGFFANSSACSPVPQGVWMASGSNTWIRETSQSAVGVTYSFPNQLTTSPSLNFPFTITASYSKRSYADRKWTTIPYTENNHSNWGTGTCGPGAPTIFRAWVNHGGSYTRLEEFEERSSKNYPIYSVFQKNGVVQERQGTYNENLIRASGFSGTGYTGVRENSWDSVCTEVAQVYGYLPIFAGSISSPSDSFSNSFTPRTVERTEAFPAFIFEDKITTVSNYSKIIDAQFTEQTRAEGRLFIAYDNNTYLYQTSSRNGVNAATQYQNFLVINGVEQLLPNNTNFVEILANTHKNGLFYFVSRVGDFRIDAEVDATVTSYTLPQQPTVTGTRLAVPADLDNVLAVLYYPKD